MFRVILWLLYPWITMVHLYYYYSDALSSHDTLSSHAPVPLHASVPFHALLSSHSSRASLVVYRPLLRL